MTRIAIALTLLLAACDRRPPAPSAAQNAQLDEAEALLNEMAENESAAR